MTTKKKVRVAFDVYDIGCLPGLLEQEIGKVGLRERAATKGSNEKMLLGAYLSQLIGCWAAVDEARKLWVLGR